MFLATLPPLGALDAFLGGANSGVAGKMSSDVMSSVSMGSGRFSFLGVAFFRGLDLVGFTMLIGVVWARTGLRRRRCERRGATEMCLESSGGAD